MRRKIGVVSELWRYPVKSMRGEALREMTLSEAGAAGDRTYAVRELKHGGILSARLFATLLQLRAYHFESGAIAIEFPDRRIFDPGDPDTAQALSAILEMPVRIEPTRPQHPTPEQLAAIVAGREYPPRRDFFDEAVVHVIASGTLDHMRRLSPGSDFDTRRFRPNIVVETEPAGRFVEDEWLDGALEIADARIVWMRPAIRCAMTIHPQWDLPHDHAVLRTAAQHHGAYVGVFASVGAPGRVALGDPVYLVSDDAQVVG